MGQIYPPLGEARLYRRVRLWADGGDRCSLVLSTIQGAKESWVVATDETPLLQTLWHDALRFRVEDLFLDSQSGAFELEESRLRCEAAKDANFCIPSHDSPMTQNLVLPRIGLSKMFIPGFGLLEFVP
ncbi:MAG: hypothetical protein WBA43_00645 [Elainellaceae cyanobacterium]